MEISLRQYGVFGTTAGGLPGGRKINGIKNECFLGIIAVSNRACIIYQIPTSSIVLMNSRLFFMISQ